MAKDRIDDVKEATAILVAALVAAQNKQDDGFTDRFVKLLDEGHGRNREKLDTDGGELLSWTRTLITGFSVVSGKGEPFFSE